MTKYGKIRRNITILSMGKTEAISHGINDHVPENRKSCVSDHTSVRRTDFLNIIAMKTPTRNNSSQ